MKPLQFTHTHLLRRQCGISSLVCSAAWIPYLPAYALSSNRQYITDMLPHQDEQSSATLIPLRKATFLIHATLNFRLGKKLVMGTDPTLADELNISGKYFYRNNFHSSCLGLRQRLSQFAPFSFVVLLFSSRSKRLSSKRFYDARTHTQAPIARTF